MSAAVPPLPARDLDEVLAQTQALWAEARGQRFFITGGTGFFGMWLLESFARANDALGLDMQAVVLTRDPAAFARKAPHLVARKDLQFVPGDIRNFTFPAGQFPFVIHAATEASAKLIEEAPQEMLATIVDGTRRVLEFCAQAGTRKLLFTSSGAVYGRQPTELTHVAEDYVGAPDPLSPGSAYAEGKRVAEHLCVVHAQRHRYEAKIARCFAFVGPHLPLDAHFAIGNFLRDALRGGPIRVAGDGTPLRSYLYAADLMVWLWTLLFAGRPGRAYNVGSDDAVSIAELAQAAAALRTPPLSVQVTQAPVLGRGPARYVPAVRRAREELNLQVRIPLPEALTRTWAWLSPER